jgi:hypothetical protein
MRRIITVGAVAFTALLGTAGAASASSAGCPDDYHGYPHFGWYSWQDNDGYDIDDSFNGNLIVIGPGNTVY